MEWLPAINASKWWAKVPLARCVLVCLLPCLLFQALDQQAKAALQQGEEKTKERLAALLAALVVARTREGFGTLHPKPTVPPLERYRYSPLKRQILTYFS